MSRPSVEGKAMLVGFLMTGKPLNQVTMIAAFDMAEAILAESIRRDDVAEARANELREARRVKAKQPHKFERETESSYCAVCHEHEQTDIHKA